MPSIKRVLLLSASALAAATIAGRAPRTQPSPPEQADLRQVPVVVKTAPERPVFAAGGPMPISVNIGNGLPRAIGFECYGTKPTDWNAESVSITLMDIYRGDDPLGLYLAGPEVTPPHSLSGMSQVTINPGQTLRIDLDASKWTIRGGWSPGVYRVNVRVDRLHLDPYTTAIITSPQATFEIR